MKVVGFLNDDKNIVLAQKIKKLRKEKNITQKELASILGVSLSSVINYENAQRFPVSSVLTLMSQYFQVSIAFLKGETDNPEIDFKWNDQNICNSVNDVMSDLFENTLKLSLNLNPHDTKMLFDIMVEILHVMSIDNKCSVSVLLDSLQESYGSITRFADICNNMRTDIEDKFQNDRLSKAEDAAIFEYKKILENIKNTLK